MLPYDYLCNNVLIYDYLCNRLEHYNTLPPDVDIDVYDEHLNEVASFTEDTPSVL